AGAESPGVGAHRRRDARGHRARRARIALRGRRGPRPRRARRPHSRKAPLAARPRRSVSYAGDAEHAVNVTRAAWWFVAPALAVIGVFFFLPVLAALLLSLTDYDL